MGVVVPLIKIVSRDRAYGGRDLNAKTNEGTMYNNLF